MNDDAKPADDATPTFEQALAELETLVQQMEGGDLALEDALAAFERGVALTKICQSALDAAELKIRTLTDADDPSA